MSIKRISAIVSIDILEPMEHKLRSCGVPGVTVEYVEGYGEHPNFFRHDLMQENARLLLYVDEAKVDGIIDVIAECTPEGILVVESIDRLVRLADHAEVMSTSP